ncbi:MAG: D-tyrosyl-tRNA(Tyr) deacylase [Treponema sp.]|jgi:D-tyrosyl-tRNA(Tyr) deacylase|nr:D-tyrosyl-tRNA(Tyr) deacylase [Treponema sp.]
MKAVIQRVKDASVSVEGALRGRVSGGLLVYLGVARGDTERDARWLGEKIPALRIFEDSGGKMNHSLREYLEEKGLSGGGVLAVSQFTLLGDARKGRRPSWGRAAPPEYAKPLYEYFIRTIRDQGFLCETGVFQAPMEVAYINDGPVTLLLDTRENITD